MTKKEIVNYFNNTYNLEEYDAREYTTNDPLRPLEIKIQNDLNDKTKQLEHEIERLTVDDFDNLVIVIYQKI